MCLDSCVRQLEPSTCLRACLSFQVSSRPVDIQIKSARTSNAFRRGAACWEQFPQRSCPRTLRGSRWTLGLWQGPLRAPHGQEPPFTAKHTCKFRSCLTRAKWVRMPVTLSSEAVSRTTVRAATGGMHSACLPARRLPALLLTVKSAGS